MKRKSMSNKRKPYSGDVTSSANGKQKISNTSTTNETKTESTNNNISMTSVNKNASRRNMPLHEKRLWLPENFASHGVVKIDRMIMFHEIWEQLLVCIIIKETNVFKEWKANTVSPDGRLLIVVCCLYDDDNNNSNRHHHQVSTEGKDGQTGKERNEKNQQHKITKTCVRGLLICWDMVSKRLLSVYDLDVSDQQRLEEQNIVEPLNSWSMTYDLRDFHHSRLFIGEENNDSSASSLARNMISVDPKPYFRSPLTHNGMKKLLVERSAHVVTLTTPTRWCKYSLE
jgi:hypothetical protein